MANNDYIDDSDEIPDNAHEMLFAEDLVRYVMQLDEDVYYPGDRFDPFGEHVLDGFNESTRKAVEFLLGTMELEHEHLFSRMQSDNAVNGVTYMRLANDTRAEYFKDGFDADRFLNYCVHLSSLAVHFYAEGIEDAPVMAVSCIVKAIQNVDMAAGGWETLDGSARRYAAMSRDATSRSSPETGSSDEVDPVAPEADSDALVPEANRVAEAADRHSVKSNSGTDEGSGAKRNKPGFDEKLVQNQLGRSKSDSEAQDHRIENICVGNEKKGAAVSSGSHESSSSPSASEVNGLNGAGFVKESSADYKLNPRASRVINNEPCPGTSYAEKFGNKLNPGPSSLARNENNPVKYRVGNKRVNVRTSFDDRNINLYLKSDAKRKLDLSPAKRINPKIKKYNPKN